MHVNPLLGYAGIRSKLEFDPTGTRAGLHVPRDGADDTVPRVWWEIKAGSSSGLLLADGSTLKELSGTASIYISDARAKGMTHYYSDGHDAWGYLQFDDAYSNEYAKAPAKYWLVLYVSERIFQWLQSVIETGKRPPHVLVTLAEEKDPVDNPIRYDGPTEYSNLVWDNLKQRYVAIREYSFDCVLSHPASVDTESDDGLYPPSKADLLTMSNEIKQASQQVTHFGRRILQALAIVVVLLVILVLRV